MRTRIYSILFILALAGIMPSQTRAITVQDLTNPNTWFDAFKKNITIPLPTVGNEPGGQIQIPTPQQTLEENAPKLKDINSQIKENAGIDFGKLIGWFTDFLKMIFQFIVSLLESLSRALSSS